MALTDFLFNTDYPLDKIVGFVSGSVSVPAGSFNQALVPHGMGFAPLTIAKWSLTSDFATSYDVTNTLSPGQVAAEVYADATNVVVRGFNFSTSTVTIYYRVVFLMPSDIDAIAAPTQNSLDNFNLNTDYNYTKLVASGVINANSGSYSHNLGYFPQVLSWWEADGFIFPSNDFTLGDNPYTTVSDSSVSFVNGLTRTAQRWHYRIYGDVL